ncbi:MAG: PKD domain-containing protein [Chlorobi bacterium]|nr:PKD domain-containing protein [Chlorobiota bacterium]
MFNLYKKAICLFSFSLFVSPFSFSQDLDNVNGIFLHLTSDSVLITNGNKISECYDLSSNHFIINQIDSFKRPVLKDSISEINYNSVIHFDGLNDYFSVNNSNISTPFTIILLGKLPSELDYNFFFDSNSYRRVAAGLTSENKLFMGNISQPDKILTSNTGQGYYNLFLFNFQNTDTSVFYINGNIVDSGITLISELGQLKIGSRNDGGDHFLDGDIAEIIIFTEQLYNDNWSFINNYLVKKYSETAYIGEDIISNYNIGEVALNVQNIFSDYLWSTGDTTSTIIIFEPGQYWVKTIDKYGLVSSDTIHVWWPQINNIPDTSFCVGDTLIWNPKMGTDYVYEWSTGSTDTILQIFEPGDYYLVITDTTGNKSYSDTTHVEVDDFSEVASLGNDTSLCIGEFIHLQKAAKRVEKYLWNEQFTDSIIQFTEEGYYNVRVNNSLGCVAYDTIFITGKGESPQVNFSHNEACAGNAILFNDQSKPPDGFTINNWQWQFDENNSSDLENPVYSFNEPGNYAINLKVVTNQGCSGSLTQNISVYSKPLANFNNPLIDKAFINLPLAFTDQTFIDSSFNKDSLTHWFWDFGNGDFSILQNPHYQYNTYGSFTINFEAISDKGCSDTVSKIINVVDYKPIPNYFTLINPPGDYLTVDTSLTFTWNLSEGAEYYKIQLYTDVLLANLFIEENNITTKQTIVSDLIKSKRYYWRVIAYNAYGDTAVSNISSFYISNPADYPNFKFWINAESGITMGADSTVSLWADKTDNGFTLSQSTSAKRPKFTFGDEAINNRPLVRFDGVDDFFTGGNILNIGTNSRTMFIVGKSNAENGNFLSKANVAPFFANNIYGVLFFNNKLNYVYQDELSQTVSVSSSTNKYQVITTKTDRYNLLNQLFVNGVLKSSKSGINDASYNMSNSYRFLVGAYNYVDDAAETYFLDGDIAEIMIMDTVLNDDETKEVENYLRYKYTPPLNLGEDIIVSYGFNDTVIQAPDIYSSYLWNTGSNIAEITVNNPGNYWLSVTDQFGYSSVDTVDVVYPEIAKMHDTTICLLDTIIWNTQLAHDYTFLWQDNSTDSIMKIYSPGNYYVAVADSFGNNIYSDTLTVSIDSFPVKPSLGDDKTVCKGSKIGLTAGKEQVIAYRWNDGTKDSLFAVTNSGAFSVQVINSNGCYAKDTINITFSGSVPEADFSAESFCPGNATQFTDLSTIGEGGNIVSQQWDFGDNSNSSDQNPAHIYSQSGTYNVTLTVANDELCEGSVTKTINIDDLDAAFISGPDTIACTSNPVSFYDLSESRYYDVRQWFWNFGDNKQSVYQNPQHLYDSSGVFQITLTAVSSENCVATFQKSIVVVDSYESPVDFTLISPYNNSYQNDTLVTFLWNKSENTYTYTLQVSTDNKFNENVIEISGIEATNYSLSLNPEQFYYWRVISNNICSVQNISSTYKFYLFRENTISGLKVWLRADGGLVKNDSLISVWNDQSGNVNSAFQTADVEKQPYQIERALNNNPVIHFDGVNDYLEIDSAIKTGSVFIVANWTGNQNQFPLYYGLLTGKSSSNSDILFLGNAGTKNLVSYGFFGSNIYINNEQTLDFSPLGNYKLIYGQSSSPSEFEGLYIGKNRNYNYFWEGNIAEVLIYDTLLTEEQTNQVIQYLHYKYAPPVNLGENIEVSYGFADTTIYANGEYISYLWSTGADTGFITVNEAGYYGVTVTDIFGFESEDLINVTYPSINQLYNRKICFGDTLKWETGLTTDYLFTWQDSSGLPYYNITSAGNYFVEVADSFGNKIHSDTLTVTVDSFPYTTGFGNDTSLCIGSQLMLSNGNSEVVSYLWDNGTTESTIDVDHEGLFSLITRNLFGCYSKDTIYVDTIGIAPHADFETDTVCFGDENVFINLSEQGDESPIVSWQWNFGNEYISTEQNPVYIFKENPINDVILKVASAKGCENSITKTVEVYKLPVVDFKPDEGCSGNEIVFKDLSFSEDANIFERVWTIRNQNFINETEVQYVFETDSTYPVLLLIIDDRGCSNLLVKNILIKPGVIADFSNSPACFGQNVYFTNLSESLMGLNLNWNWNFGDDSTSTFNNPVHQFDNLGSYDVNLFVNQIANGCSDSIVKTVVVNPTPKAALPELNACEKATFQFIDTSTIETGNIVNWQWQIDTLGSYYSQSPDVFMPDTGLFNVRLIVKSDSSCYDTVNGFVMVYPSPAADFNYYPSPVVIGKEVLFSNLSSGSINYLWNFGDLESSEIENPTHVYSDTGRYQVSLNAISEFQCIDTEQKDLNVVFPHYDIEVVEVQVQAKEGLIDIEAKVANLGSVLLSNVELAVSYENGGEFSEILGFDLEPNNLYDYQFTSNIKLTQQVLPGYVCVRAILPNQIEDEHPDDNIKCVSLSSQSLAFDPYPNPGTDEIRIMFNLMIEGDAEIILYNQRGDKVKTIFSGQANTGLNSLNFNIKNLPNGLYTYVIISRDQMLTKRFVKM